MNATLLRKVETDAFRNAMREWLAGDVTGHLGGYMYTDDRDDNRWKNGHSAETYYLGRDDKAAFNLAINDLDIRADNFLDLGPGGEASVRTKSMPITQMLKARNYYPVDLSATLAREAHGLLQQECGAQGTAVIADFFDHIPGVKNNALIAIMGGTIGNFETHADPVSLNERLAGIFAMYRKAVGNDSHFLLSFDANTDGEQIVACYNSPEFDDLIRSCVDRLIDTDGFDYHVAWTPENFQLAMGLRANRDQIVNFDGEQFAIEKGEFLPVLNSYRFPVSFVQQAAEMSGWQHQKTWSATGRVHYLLFKGV